MACCSTYNAGMLSEPVSIQRATKAPDGEGGYTEVWGSLSGSANRAYVKALSGSERFASERIEATAKFRAVVRYFPGLAETDTIVIRDRRHNIRFVNNVELKDRWLEIDLDQGVAN